MLPVEQPFKTYTGLDGKPLDNGYVYFGQPNQNPITAPITVYWDAAGTIPAAQPLRTVNGYLMRGGSPANVFIGGAYSTTVLDSKKRQVFYAKTSDEFSISKLVSDFLASLLTSPGSSLVGFVLGSVNAIKTTLQAKGRERPSLLDFMSDAQRADVIGNVGSLDVTDAVQKAFDAYVDPEAPAGRYKVTKPLVITSNLHSKGRKRKTVFVAGADFTAGNVTRTYTDSAGVTQTRTFNDKAIFYVVPPNGDYIPDFVMDGYSFELPSDGSIGVFNMQRVCYSSLRNMYCNTSAYFLKGYDLFQCTLSDVRSRYSKAHYNVDTGTSVTFTNVAADSKHASGGTGFTLTNLFYSSMTGAAADALDQCYEFNNSQVTMNGCGAESFSRLIRATNGSIVNVNGGALQTYKNANLTNAFTPYEFSGANTQVNFNGTWLGIANPGVGGTSTYDRLVVASGAKVVLNNVRKPVELGTPPWYVTGTGSLLTVLDESGPQYINPSSTSRRDGINNLKYFAYTKTIAPGAAQSIFRIAATAAGSGYGDNCRGKIEVWLSNGYAVGDLGFSGLMEFKFSGFKEATAAQDLTLAGQSITVSNTGSAGFGGVTGALVRNADGTLDFQLNVANAPQPVGNTIVTVFVEYMTNSGTLPSSNVITGL